jgi:hypothetical protein
MKPTSYTKPYVLGDVMALIQILAQAEWTLRTESGIVGKHNFIPKYGGTWTALAEDHREVFRVRQPTPENPKRATLALISRHVFPEDSNGERKPLSPEVTQKLLEIAISLHDREETRRQRLVTMLSTIIPIGVAIIAGLFSITVALLQIANQAPK